MGNDKVLTIVDTAGIQDYVFRTNKLRQIIGASALVNNATNEWVQKALKNMPKDKLVYSGGGNAVLIFENIDNAKQFASKLSKITLDKAPGLRLVISHTAFDYNTKPLGGPDGIINKTFEQLDRLKAEGNPWAYETSLGVTEECLFTGQPVVLESVGKSYDTLLSSEALAKHTAETDQLEKFSKKVDDKEYTFYFAEDMDHITGENSDKNLIGIVHIDGNDIGKKIINLVNKHGEPKDNTSLCEALKCFSKSIKTASENTLNSLLTELAKLYAKKGEFVLPIRPIVLGGDDTTLICDGSLALDLTVRYLETAQTQKLSDGSKYNCKAGVCIVKKNFPIFPAYQLSNQLAGSAKRFRKELIDQIRTGRGLLHCQITEQDLPTIDWQICLNGIQGSLSDIRQTEYMGHDGKLYMRPLVIPDINDNCTWPDGTTYWRNWNQFMTLFNEMNNKDIISKNKAKELREHLRLSEEHIVNFLTLNGINLNKTYCNGWHDGRSPYFDALEIQDIFKKLA